MVVLMSRVLTLGCRLKGECDNEIVDRMRPTQTLDKKLKEFKNICMVSNYQEYMKREEVWNILTKTCEKDLRSSAWRDETLELGKRNIRDYSNKRQMSIGDRHLTART